MKKGFTLLEILISITIFSIVILFLYQTLDITQKSNNFYSQKLKDKQNLNNFKKLIFRDIINKQNDIKIELDRDNNHIVKYQTKNTYHNPFYNNITYFVTKDKELVRIESKTIFDEKNINDEFFNTAYIDIIAYNIEKFKINTSKDKTSFYIKKSNNIEILIGI
jgi:prepilin-type N-terminal cleavage/methylation domain-containing protein